DGVLRAVDRGGDVEPGGEEPYLGGVAFEPPGEDEAGVVAFMPGPGQVDRDPVGDGLVVAVPQLVQEGGVQHGLAGVPGGPDGGRGLAEGVAGLPGPDLGFWVDGVGVVEVAVQVGQALLDSGEPGVVAEVAAVVVADQDPGVAVQDPEPGDCRLRPVPGCAVPDEIGPAAGPAAQGPHRVYVRVPAVFRAGRRGGQRGGGLVGAEHVRRPQRVFQGGLEASGGLTPTTTGPGPA